MTDMNQMFHKFTSLKEINLKSFETNKVTNMIFMFSKCSDELKSKIKNKFVQFN